jgi:hypothetical protein
VQPKQTLRFSIRQPVCKHLELLARLFNGLHF